MTLERFLSGAWRFLFEEPAKDLASAFAWGCVLSLVLLRPPFRGRAWFGLAAVILLVPQYAGPALEVLGAAGAGLSRREVAASPWLAVAAMAALTIGILRAPAVPSGDGRWRGVRAWVRPAAAAVVWLASLVALMEFGSWAADVNWSDRAWPESRVDRFAVFLTEAWRSLGDPVLWRQPVAVAAGWVAVGLVPLARSPFAGRWAFAAAGVAMALPRLAGDAAWWVVPAGDVTVSWPGEASPAIAFAGRWNLWAVPPAVLWSLGILLVRDGPEVNGRPVPRPLADPLFEVRRLYLAQLVGTAALVLLYVAAAVYAIPKIEEAERRHRQAMAYERELEAFAPRPAWGGRADPDPRPAGPGSDESVASRLFTPLLYGPVGSLAVEAAFCWLLLPSRRPDGLYLRAFRRDSASRWTRRAIRRGMGKPFRVSGIRPPAVRVWIWLRAALLGVFVVRYAFSRYLNLEAGDDWRARLWASLGQTRAVFLDLTDLTEHVWFEVRLSHQAVGLRRILFVIDETRGPDEWVDLVVRELSLGEPDRALVRTAVWSPRWTSSVPAEFLAAVDAFRAQLPAAAAGRDVQSYPAVSDDARTWRQVRTDDLVYHANLLVGAVVSTLLFVLLMVGGLVAAWAAVS